MAKLANQIREWTDQGFIDVAQAEQILKFEENRPRSSWQQYGIITLGVLVVGMGVVSLISANWHRLGDLVKLTGAFGLLGAIALFGYRFHARENHRAYDGAILALNLMVLATIGLIAQIYHSTGRPGEAVLLWCLLTLPAVLTTKFLAVPFIWVSGFIFSSLDWLAVTPLFDPETFQLVIAMAPFWVTILAALARFGVSRIGLTDGLLRSFQFYLLYAVLAALANAEFVYYRSSSSRNFALGVFSSEGSGLYRAVLIFASAAVTSVLLFVGKEYSKIQRMLIIVLIGLYLSSFLMLPFYHGLPLLPAVWTIVELGLLSAYFASLRQSRVFNLMLILLGLRFFGLFLQALGGLAATGFGLIVSGGVLILLALAWNKYRQKIEARLEQMTQPQGSSKRPSGGPSSGEPFHDDGGAR